MPYPDMKDYSTFLFLLDKFAKGKEIGDRESIQVLPESSCLRR